MIVYKATNKATGKSYIGKTVRTLEERKSDHIHSLTSGKNYAFCNSLRKHGVDSFVWEIIGTASSEDELNRLEIDLISEHSTMVPNGYNLTAGGEGCTGMVFPEESKRMLSELNMGEKNPFFGKRHTKKTIIKIREKMSGTNHPRYGKPIPSSHRRAIEKPVIVAGIKFDSITKAADGLGIPYTTIRNRLANEKFTDYRRVS
jgi:group I intron endonuclease